VVRISKPVSRVAGLYVGAVVALSAAGFVTGAPAPIMAAAVLTLPASLVMLPAYYLAYGLLALVPGANPSSGSGSGSASAGGRAITEVATGDPAVWFSVVTSVLGVVALGLAAVLDVVLLQRIAARRRPVTSPGG
jgi:hypothetical protein